MNAAHLQQQSAALWDLLSTHSHRAVTALAAVVRAPAQTLPGLLRGGYSAEVLGGGRSFPAQRTAAGFTWPSPRTLRTVVLPGLLALWVLLVLARGDGQVGSLLPHACV
jgi:hypothetical protein